MAEAERAHYAAVAAERARAILLAWLVCAAVIVLTIMTALFIASAELKVRAVALTATAFGVGAVVLLSSDAGATAVYVTNLALAAGAVLGVRHWNAVEQLKRASTPDSTDETHAEGGGEHASAAPPAQPRP